MALEIGDLARRYYVIFYLVWNQYGVNFSLNLITSKMRNHTSSIVKNNINNILRSYLTASIFINWDDFLI